jgi:hypothetical protein
MRQCAASSEPAPASRKSRRVLPMPSALGASLVGRLHVAGNGRVPIGEAPLRVVLPRPDMQFVKRR